MVQVFYSRLRKSLPTSSTVLTHRYESAIPSERSSINVFPKMLNDWFKDAFASRKKKKDFTEYSACL